MIREQQTTGNSHGRATNHDTQLEGVPEVGSPTGNCPQKHQISRMFHHVPWQVAEARRGEKIEVFVSLMERANEKRCVAMIWEAEMENEVTQRLVTPITCGDLMTDAKQEAYQNAARRFARRKKAEILGGEPRLRPVVIGVGDTAAATDNPLPRLNVDADATAGLMDEWRVRHLRRQALRLMNGAIGKANKVRLEIMLWTLERRELPGPNLMTVLLRRDRLTPFSLKGAYDDADDVKHARERFNEDKRERMILTAVAVGEPQVLPTTAPEFDV